MRYVVLHHTGYGAPHYDLMFETSPGSTLATWRSNEWPVTAASVLDPIAEHRRDYLDYEGPVARGRGSVVRIASGTHVVRQNDSAQLVVELSEGVVLRLPRTVG